MTELPQLVLVLLAWVLLLLGSRQVLRRTVGSRAVRIYDRAIRLVVRGAVSVLTAPFRFVWGFFRLLFRRGRPQIAIPPARVVDLTVADSPRRRGHDLFGPQRRGRS